MSGWKTTRLSDLCTKVTSGGTPLRSVRDYYEGGTIPWLKTGEVKKRFVWETEEHITERGLRESSAKLIPSNSVIVAMYGDGDTAGNVAINKAPLATNQACCNFVLNPAIADYRFVYHYLKGSYNNLVGLKLGGSQQNLNAATLKSFPINLPSLAVQQKIAAILSAYDDLIANNQRRITLLERMAEDIYREWFVRLRFPGHEQVKIEKGIPLGWKQSTLGAIADFTMGQSPSSEYFNDIGNGLPFHQGVGSYGPLYPNHETFCSVSGRKAKPGDILFSVRAPVGRLNIADRELIIGRGLAAIRHKRGRNGYLFYLLKVTFASEDIIGNGSIFNSVGKDELARLGVFEPSSELTEKFEAYVQPIDRQVASLYRANASLKATRDALLPRLISGRLAVDGLDIHFPPGMWVELDKNPAI